MTHRYTEIDTRIGRLTVVADRDRVRGIYFPGHWTRPDPTGFGVRVAPGDADGIFADVARQLDDYLAGRRTAFDLPLATAGDAWSEHVWDMLRQIPYGSTVTYGDLADRLGNRHLAQTVGQAVGHNPISIVIPCHRVLGADGSLTGFAGGLARKRHLLELEGALPTALLPLPV